MFMRWYPTPNTKWGIKLFPKGIYLFGVIKLGKFGNIRIYKNQKSAWQKWHSING